MSQAPNRPQRAARALFVQGTGLNIATGSFQEWTCQEKENVFQGRKQEGDSTNNLLASQFSKGFISDKKNAFFFLKASFFLACLCRVTLTKQTAERRVCGVIGVPLGIVAGRGNPVLLGATGWGRKTFGAITAVQLGRRERNTFTCKTTSAVTDSVNAEKLQDAAPICV